jgi:outer membrane protein assembly factor BamB
VCLVGTHAGQAKALDAATGRELWSYACERYHGRTGSVGTIFPADLDGDGGHEVVAGSDNWHYHGLSDKGQLLWRFNAVHACTPGAAGDFDGDGRDDVVAASEYYGLRLCNHAGRRVGGAGGGPVVCASAAFDLDGDGKDEAFMAMEDASVRCLREGKLAWRTNVGGAATAIAPLDVDGDGAPEVLCASESFSVYALRADGAVAWRRPLPDCATALAVLGNQVVVGCDDGRAYVLDAGGRIVSAVSLGAPAAAAAALGGRVAAIAAGPQVVAVGVGP